jgi:PPOX class probable F420-dependent enzyme
MELHDGIDFARTTRRSVLATISPVGHPQLSNVLHHVFDDGVIRISITATRVKYRNLAHQPWAALHVTSDDFFAYVVLEADVELTPVVTRIDDPTVEEHIAHYRAVVGERDDWDAYREGLVTERRTLARLRPTRAYGMLQLPPATGTE